MIVESLPWFIWEEVISYLNQETQWRLLTVDKVWCDKIVANRLQVVHFKVAKSSYCMNEQLIRHRKHVRSLFIFSPKQVEPQYFNHTFPKLKHLRLSNLSSDGMLLNMLVKRKLIGCFERLSYLSIDGEVEKHILDNILTPAKNLQELWLSLEHLDTKETMYILERLQCFNLIKIHIKMKYLELRVFGMMVEKFEKLQYLQLRFSESTPNIFITKRHLPPKIKTLLMSCPPGIKTDSILFDSEATKNLRMLSLGKNASFSGRYPQRLENLRIRSISAETGVEVLSLFENIASLFLNCSKCSPGLAVKLIYGLKRLKVLKIKHIADNDPLFQGPALTNIETLYIHMKTSSLNATLYIFRAFPALFRLSLGFRLPDDSNLILLSFPKLPNIHFLAFKKCQDLETYHLLLNISPNLITLAMPKKDFDDQPHLRCQYPAITFKRV
ncbi:hypothetical protein DSO57_1031146 [Entomophthora muscae]|uniref:Uncharacterized protein n=1 Tax=Entomophthora muscae TaxID=34485 RepID=A0ACC2SQL0_9FUNG|nr:hypothetical protein DSO57_1031146 [Entomophthora muscae]